MCSDEPESFLNEIKQLFNRDAERLIFTITVAVCAAIG
jgi:hypothetical protein